MPLLGWCRTGHHADCPHKVHAGTYVEPKQEPHNYGSLECTCDCHAADYSPHA